MKRELRKTAGEFVIRCNHRSLYFVAIHGYSPFYSTIEKAKRFADFDDAVAYGRKELFTTDDAFAVINLAE